MNLLPAKIWTACAATCLRAKFRIAKLKMSKFCLGKLSLILSLMLFLSSHAAYAGNETNSKPLVAPSAKERKVKEMLTYGTARHREGNFPEAESVFRSVLYLDPTNVDAFYNLGALAERRGDYINALSNYRAALNLKPDDKQVLEAIKAVEGILKVQESFPPRLPAAGNYSGTGESNYSSGFPDFPAPVPPSSSLNALPGETNLPPGTIAVGNFTLPASPADSPAVTLPLSNLSDPPPKLDTVTGSYQLSSSQQALKNNPGVIPVTPQSTPVPTLPVAGASNPAKSRSKAVMRSMLNSALNYGTSYALRSTGLHCPLCRVIRFHF